MTERRQEVTFWSGTLLAALAGASAWLVDLLNQPPCGAPQQTFLGWTLSYGPVVLLVAQIIVVAGLGVWARRRPAKIVIGVVLAGMLAAVVGILIFVYWFSQGNCGE